MDYQTIKTIHIGAVTLSASGFAVRGLAALRGAAWVQGRLAKTLPHVLDTLLLLSALGLVWMLRLNPLLTPWLLAKILGLLLYIGLGMVSLRPRLSPALRATTWLSALLVLGWMASVAVSKNPLGFL